MFAVYFNGLGALRREGKNMSIFRVDVKPMAWFSLSFDSCWGKGLTVKLTGVYAYWDNTNFIGNY